MGSRVVLDDIQLPPLLSFDDASADHNNSASEEIHFPMQRQWCHAMRSWHGAILHSWAWRSRECSLTSGHAPLAIQSSREVVRFASKCLQLSTSRSYDCTAPPSN